MRSRRPRRPGAARRNKPETIDAYLAGVEEAKRAALQHLRRTIRDLVPRAEECISYRIPAFRLDGTVVAGFCARARGLSYFPFSGSTLETFSRKLEGYERTKSAPHFDIAHPLPESLVRELLHARMAEIGR